MAASTSSFTHYQHGEDSLGLAIIKGIVESQEGKVWIESKQGVGTTFYFTLPLTPVKVIKPIKLLFSSKKDITRKIEKLFVEVLGPMGTQEFENLKRKNQVNKRDLIWYANLLIKKGILDKEKGEVFKIRILDIFGESPAKKIILEENVRGFFKRGKNE